MAQYCYRCPTTGWRITTMLHQPAPSCPVHQHSLVRDYKAEGVGFAIAKLTREREEGTDRDIAKLFLPDASEFASPTDPDGSAGIRKWNEEHVAMDSEARAIRPEAPSKRSF